MSLITHSVKNLINGVSQQPPSVRLDNQLEEQVNMIPDVTKGLLRRNPVALQSVSAHDGSRVYTEEHPMFTYSQYGEKVSIGIKPDGTVYRFDKDHTLTTVNMAVGTATYLTHTDKNRISFLETSDKVYILNKDKVVSEKAASTELSNTRGLVWLDNVTTGVTYTLTIYKRIAGVLTLRSTQSHTAVAGDSEFTVLLFLFGTHPDITSVNYSAKAFTANFIDNGDYEIAVTTDYGLDTIHALMEAKTSNTYSIKDPSMLPTTINIGDRDAITNPFIVRVQPDIRDTETSYYLGYDKNNVLWVETRLRAENELDEITMPVIISKNAVSDVDVAFNTELVTPASGDRYSNKSPSFVNNTISDMFIFNSRLGFASGNKLTFSEIDNFDTFYRTTCSQVLTSDRVDITLDTTRLTYKDITSVFAVGSNLFVSTGISQSLLQTTSDLDLSKASFINVSSFYVGDLQPFSNRNSVLFPVTIGSYSIFTDFSPDSVTGNSYVSNNINKHCDTYITGKVEQIVSTSDMMFVRVSSNKKVLYVQNSFVLDSKLIQNAWSKYTFEFDIKHLYSEGNMLYLVCEDTANAQTVYGELNLIPNTVVDDIYTAGVLTQIGYKPYLDFYTTDHTLLYTWNAGTSTWDANTAGTLSVNSKTSQVVTNPDAVDIVSGIPFDSYLELSEQVPRVSDDQGKSKLAYAKLMLRRIQCTLGLSGRLKVTVGKKHRDDTVYTHMPVVLNGITIGREAVADTDLRFSINADARDTSVRISTVTFTPFNILEYEYQGQLITKGSRF